MPKGVGMKKAGFVGLMIAKKHLRRNPESYDPNARPKSTPELFDQDLIQAPSKYIKENMYEQSTRIRSAMKKMGDIKKKNIVRRAVKGFVQRFKDRAVGAMDEITPEDMVAFVNQYKRNGVEGVAYSAYAITGEMMWLYLLKKYKNECYIVDFKKVSGVGYVYTAGIKVSKMGVPEKDTNETGMVSSMKDCLEIKAPLMVIPLTLPSHQNMMIYRPALNTIERFEPHGERTGFLTQKQNERLDNRLKKFFEQKKFNPIFKRTGVPEFQYLKPQDLRSGLGFQAVENRELAKYQQDQKKKLGPSYEGFCQMWAYFYLELTMRQPNLTGKEILDKAFTALEGRDGVNKFLNHITAYVEENEKEINKMMSGFSFKDIQSGLKGAESDKAWDEVKKYYRWFDKEVRKALDDRRNKNVSGGAMMSSCCDECEY